MPPPWDGHSSCLHGIPDSCFPIRQHTPNGDTTTNWMGVYFPCGFIGMSHGGCICGEIIVKLIDFALLGGACAPRNHSVVLPLHTHVSCEHFLHLATICSIV